MYLCLKITREWRKLHNEELNDLYSLPNNAGGKIEKNEMGGACGAYGGGERCVRERDHWRDPRVDGRIILRWIFRMWEGVVGTVWSWFRIGRGGGHL